MEVRQRSGVLWEHRLRGKVISNWPGTNEDSPIILVVTNLTNQRTSRCSGKKGRIQTEANM